MFPAGVWEPDVEKRYPAGSKARAAAEDSRRVFEAEGVPERELQACEAEGPDDRSSAAEPRDGTRLECMREDVPAARTRDPRERPFGIVFVDVGREEPALVLIAYGVRHPPVGSRQPTVYQLADRRLHPPTPDSR